MKDKIIVTGIGFISNIGTTLEEYARAREGINEKLISENNYNPDSFYEISDFSPKKYINRKLIKSLDLVTRYCISACNLVLKDLGMNNSEKDGKVKFHIGKHDDDFHYMNNSDIGIISGGMYHGIESIFNIKKEYYEGGIENVSPLFFPGTVFNASASQAAIEHHFTGPNSTVNSAMTSGLLAIIKGVQYLRMKRAKLLICGASEMKFDYITYKYHKLGVLSNNIYRPFDTNGDGILLGEGGCYFSLESEQEALLHTSQRYAEIISYSSNYCPDIQNFESSIACCINDTLHKDDIDYTALVDLIIVDGFAKEQFDLKVVNAIKSVFKNTLPYISCNESTIGHTLGASGAFNVLEGVLSLTHQKVYPIANLQNVIVDGFKNVSRCSSMPLKYVLIMSIDIFNMNIL